jgi:uncharacterized membrane protein
VTAGTASSAEPAGLREGFGEVLRGGVVVSAALLLVGLALVLHQGGVGLAGSVGALPLGALAADLASGQAWAYLWLGVVVLAATPVVRVLLALEVFARARDREYVAITGFVLAVLLASLVLGVAAG